MKVSNHINFRAQSECIHFVSPIDENMLFQIIHSHSFPQESDMAPTPEEWFPHNWESLVYGITKKDYSWKVQVFYSISG